MRRHKLQHFGRCFTLHIQMSPKQRQVMHTSWVPVWHRPSQTKDDRRKPSYVETGSRTDDDSILWSKTTYNLILTVSENCTDRRLRISWWTDQARWFCTIIQLKTKKQAASRRVCDSVEQSSYSLNTKLNVVAKIIKFTSQSVLCSRLIRQQCEPAITV